MNLAELNEAFGVPDAARFEEGAGGLIRLAVDTDACEARVYLHGAHVTRWRPKGEAPALFCSAESAYADGAPIRGGVPVCIPWFGLKEDDPDAPLHGFARLYDWEVESVRCDSAGVVRAVFTFRNDERAREIWPHDFECRYAVAAGRGLNMTLSARNAGAAPFTLSEALHTYFSVDDAREVAIFGLEGREYYDKADRGRRKRQGDGPIRIAAETDRAYTGVEGACAIVAPGMNRRVAIEKSGSRTTVVWNPWAVKASRMADFGDEEWTKMVCVETANALEDAVTLAPGAAHTMEARIRLERLD